MRVRCSWKDQVSINQAEEYLRQYEEEIERRHAFFIARVDPFECHFAFGPQGIGWAVGAGGNEWLSRLFVQDVYDLWEAWCRPRVAEALGVNLQSVTCPIMRDIRIIRNCLHKKNTDPLSALYLADLRKIRYLQGLWGSRWLDPLRIEPQMVREMLDLVHNCPVFAGDMSSKAME